MTKRSKTTLFGLLALIAAFGLILTGCPDAAGSETTKDPVPTPTDVRLTPGSHGFAYEDTIIGLVPGKQYVVREGAKWYAVKANGTLATTTYNTPVAALGDTDAAALAVAIADPPAPAVKAIQGLTKGTSYSVYAVYATAIVAGDPINAAVTGSKHTIVTLASALATGDVVTIAADLNRVDSSLVVLTASTSVGAIAIEPAGAVTDYTRIKGKTSGLTYQFSEVAGSADLQAVAVDDKYFVLDNIDETFAATITATTPATTVELTLGAFSGAAAATEITTIAIGTYVVQNRGNWYSVIGSGTTATLTAATPNDPVTAAAASSAMSAEFKITQLTNDEVYDVYAYVSVSGDVTNGGVTKNTIYNLVTNHAVKFGAAGRGKHTYIFLVGTGIIAQGSTGGGGSFAAGSVKLYYDSGQTYFTVMGNGTDSACIYGITRTSAS